MQDAGLFIHSAEIAGVFVGFGALIAIRSGATMAATEINAIRRVMTSGIRVVVVALTPAFIASYGVRGHELWLACSLPALGLLAAVLVVFPRTRAHCLDRSDLADERREGLRQRLAALSWRPSATRGLVPSRR